MMNDHGKLDAKAVAATEKENDPGKLDTKAVAATEKEVVSSVSPVVRKPLAGRKPARGRSPTLFVIKYLLLPALVAGWFVMLGAHLGASGPQAWYTRAVLWIAGLF